MYIHIDLIQRSGLYCLSAFKIINTLPYSFSMKVIATIFISLVLLLVASLGTGILVNSQSSLGKIHPLFALLKMISPAELDAPTAAALAGQNPAALADYRHTVTQFYQLSRQPEFNGQIRKHTIQVKGAHQLEAISYRPNKLKPQEDGGYAAILYFHGGGFSAGSTQAVSKLAQAIAQRSQAIVITPSYRLAPEHPFPAAFDDARAALDWLFSQQAKLQLSPAKIFVAGDSAGGNLAAAVALAHRDRLGLGLI
ncbi:MAG: alpha/beta hydrolase fold domain-containing protein [Pseudomonadales bacterium]|nr:alpha/beta hydrolase fold domain-containing protein [Pseudomonadales bacterium]